MLALMFWWGIAGMGATAAALGTNNLLRFTGAAALAGATVGWLWPAFEIGWEVTKRWTRKRK